MVVVVAWYLHAQAVAEAKLPPEERIRRNFEKAFDPSQSTLSRISNLQRSFKNAKEVPTARRREVIVGAIADSMNRTILDFSTLPQEKKADRAKELQEDAEKTLNYFHKLPLDKQEQAISLLVDTPTGRSAMDSTALTLANTLSPQDREMLAPTINTWKKMLEKKE